MINQSPESFLVLITLSLVWLFYVINNFYFGLMYEIARVLDNLMKGNDYGFFSSSINKSDSEKEDTLTLEATDRQSKSTKRQAAS